jgi:hypothetical protein
MYIKDLGFHAGSAMTLGLYLRALSGITAYRPLFQRMLCLLGRRLDGLLLHPVLPAASARPLLSLKGQSTGPAQSDLALESKLVVHMGQCRAACGELLHLSLAVDKSRVGNLAIQSAAGCLPTNVAFVMPPQAIRATKTMHTNLWHHCKTNPEPQSVISRPKPVISRPGACDITEKICDITAKICDITGLHCPKCETFA